MSAVGGKADLIADGSELPPLAEGVEKVPRTRIFETMIQNQERR
jgi:hypothetical protein